MVFEQPITARHTTRTSLARLPGTANSGGALKTSPDPVVAEPVSAAESQRRAQSVQDAYMQKWQKKSGNRRKPPVPPLTEHVQPILAIYHSCQCSRGQRHGTVRSTSGDFYVRKGITREHTLSRIHGQAFEKLDRAGSHQSQIRDAGLSDGYELVVFTALFGYESRLSLRDRRVRHKRLRAMATTNSVEEAWTSYRELASMIPIDTRVFIPWEYLHRFVRLVASVRPRARTHLDYLTEVLARIHETGGVVQTWEWNVLMDTMGKGLRRTTRDQFEDVLGVYNDLINQRPPSQLLRRWGVWQSKGDSGTRTVGRPDGVTLATLLNLASRTKDHKMFEHAIVLLRASGVRPGHDVYVTLLAYHTSRRNLRGVRAVVTEMKRRNIELGLVGLNSYIWALARLGQIDPAQKIFHALRGNKMAQHTAEIKNSREYLARNYIEVPTDVVPDEITYTTMIQAYSYTGQFKKCIRTFVEMIKTFDPGSPSDSTPKSIPVDALLPAYRAIFVGFYYHSKPDLPTNSPLVRQTLSIIKSSGWTLPAFQTIFQDWIQLPHKAQPNSNTLYWILRSADTLSGGDPDFLRGIVEQLEGRFGIEWGGRLAAWKRKKIDSTLED
ncbi:hypothetical protein BDW22DRAFT_1425438 [Trametopsis cervina]|nr:hypothetical protein BDW22DRAFT_1425438 [Trametopsis cervina]